MTNDQNSKLKSPTAASGWDNKFDMQYFPP